MKNKVNSSMINTPAIIGSFDGKCADSIENNNSMLLSTELWEKLFASDEFKHFIEVGHYIGFLGHPEDPGCQDFKEACIIMREGHVDENGEVFGRFDLIDTPVGRIVKTLIDAGVKFGISVRGAGDVGPDGYVDPDTFVFRGFDLVAFPAYDDAIPDFEIAASTDPAKAAIYKSVCKTIDENIDKVMSASSIDVLQSQFNSNSPQYKKLESRKNIINGSKLLSIDKQKLEAMTDLYLKAKAENVRLSRKLATIKASEVRRKQHQIKAAETTRKIVDNQLNSSKASIDELTKRCDILQATNLKLKQHIEDVREEHTRYIRSSNDTISELEAKSKKLSKDLDSKNSNNLKYRQKIESMSHELDEKDSVISSLRTELNKTVVSSKSHESKTSNLDAKISDLKKQISAANDLISEYQQAYADLYANIIGVHIDSIPVTASTKVDELKSLIRNGTSTSNMPALADMSQPVDILDDDDADSMITL